MKSPRKSRRIQDARRAKKPHGGARRRAGRKPAGSKEGPPEIPDDLLPAPVPGIDWRAVWRAAWTSANAGEIQRGLQISDAALAPPEVLAAFRRVVDVGNARGLLCLKDLISCRSMKTRRDDGSSYVLALRARNEADYDKQLPSQETEPDLSTARQRIKDLLVRMAEAQSEIRGRTVTVLELLAEEAGIVEAAKKKADDEG